MWCLLFSWYFSQYSNGNAHFPPLIPSICIACVRVFLCAYHLPRPTHPPPLCVCVCVCVVYMCTCECVCGFLMVLWNQTVYTDRKRKKGRSHTSSSCASCCYGWKMSVLMTRATGAWCGLWLLRYTPPPSFTHTHMCEHTYTHTHSHKHTSTHEHAHSHARTQAHIHTRACKHGTLTHTHKWISLACGYEVAISMHCNRGQAKLVITTSCPDLSAS